MCSMRRVRPHFFENIHHARSSQGNTILADVSEWIVAVRLRRVGRVEINNSVPLRCRNACCDARDKIAVWIDESETVPALQVLESHHFDQRRFAGTGLADHVYVRTAIIALSAERA